MSEESVKPVADQPAQQSKEGSGPAQSREEMMAAIKARAAALRAAKSGGATPAPGATEPSVAPTPADHTARAQSSGPDRTAAGAPAPPGSDASPADKLAAIKARAEALRAAKAGGAPPTTAGGSAGAAPPARPTAAPASLEVPVSSLNPGGRPGAVPQSPSLEALGTLNQSVEITAAAGEAENLKKLLGGLGAYQNPLRSGIWQVDYRYYAEARRRLESAGYTITEKDYLGRSMSGWNPKTRGWTNVDS